jgi:DNA-binding GntR family transcriptional regulator
VDDTTIGDSIARRLARDILLGRLRPRERITQEDVSERFGTSRMPARDAIRQLLAQGVLTQDGRVVRVAPLTVDDIDEIYELDGVLHGIAARRAARMRTPELVADLRALCAQLDDALQAQDADQATSLNWEFHRRVNHAGASARLRSLLRMMNTPRGYISEVLHHSDTVIKEHALIVDCIERGDAAGAERAASDHIRAAAHDVIEHLKMLHVIEDDDDMSITEELHRAVTRR